jgi:hypothetical protein
MAVTTPCQTPGAVYSTDISDRRVIVVVELGRSIKLTESGAKLLEDNIHNAMDLILARYYVGGT